MKRNLALCLLAWFFFYGKTDPQLYGPFLFSRSCEYVKARLVKWEAHPRHVSECFWEDDPPK